MNKKVLLTGISGYIGNHCAVELLKNGYSVRGSVRSFQNQIKLLRQLKKK
jgi:dihydroflavonol-4-reductase